MALQYWVGDFFVDLSRNQITQKEQPQIVAPKALAVLTYLAENQGRVVSYDELFSSVWPNTVVTPNTLQRCIAQLRKVLGEDSKRQSFIKTHAKQGYSLECVVKWQDETQAISKPHFHSEQEFDTKLDILREASKGDKSVFPSLVAKVLFVFAAVFTLGFIGVKILSSSQTSDFSFGGLRSLTATDNKELAGIYSPDGEYIVFQRYSEELCIKSNIWAKNTKTQQEFRLTKNWGSYGSHSFSKDGNKLVFIEKQSCDKPVTQKKCYKLISLDFKKALENPQSPSLLLECENSRIVKPTWLNNNNIALFQELSNRWKLISYSIAENRSTEIYAPQEGNLIYYDYSVADDLIALIRIHNDGNKYIEILKPDGQVLSSHQIQYPPEIPNLRFIYPNFTPISEALIFSTGRQLFTLSHKGKIENISLPLDEPMGSPTFHPDGKRMLVIKGHYDSDIATIALSRLAQVDAGLTLTKGNENYSIIERSTVGEDDAIYQPGGDLIAYMSTRSGEQQIWVTDGNGSRQLTHFPIDTYIDGLDWASDGNSVLVNANNRLTHVNLDSNQKNVAFEHRIEKLFQWNSERSTALAIARIKGIIKFVEINLNNSEFRVITDKKVKWALKTEDGRLIYTDHLDRFWQPGPVEDQLIGPLDDQGSDMKFVTKNNVVYGINEEFQWWSYDLNEATFEILGNTPNNVDYLTDINETDILLTIRITAKKEVAELSLTN